MKIVAFGGSTSRESINKRLATYAASLFEGADVEVLDLNDFEMPIFSVDKEKIDGHPEEAKLFIKKMRQADLIIASMAEHNGSYSAAFKNILDWASRIDGKVFQEKPMLLMATSPGRRGGGFVLEAAKTRFPIHGAQIIATFSLPEFEKNFSDSDGIIDEDIKSSFMSVIDTTKAQIAF
ncbi:MAG: NAD(P)H-dependent oxidoreductase [Saprospiraceae bacterium]